jgi:hypothetical protein
LSSCSNRVLLNFWSINTARLYISTVSLIPLGSQYFYCETEGNRRMEKMCI